ncbi:hypothetical protein [Paenibacillus pinihumi]|uniref:hypothetical protein n=1 Tax=Paenibacillus pinihumi TaxID=669462 RepID=UPI00040C0C2C|nr:hypothetical protein [Paenibacillus pinihumi]
MNKRAAGVVFISLAVILFIFRNSVYYMSGAIIAARNGEVNTGMLASALDLIEQPYSILPEIVCLIVGAGYVIWAEMKKE